jgi:hypothetical protein
VRVCVCKKKLSARSFHTAAVSSWPFRSIHSLLIAMSDVERVVFVRILAPPLHVMSEASERHDYKNTGSCEIGHLLDGRPGEPQSGGGGGLCLSMTRAGLWPSLANQRQISQEERRVIKHGETGINQLNALAAVVEREGEGGTAINDRPYTSERTCFKRGARRHWCSSGGMIIIVIAMSIASWRQS